MYNGIQDDSDLFYSFLIEQGMKITCDKDLPYYTFICDIREFMNHYLTLTKQYFPTVLKMKGLSFTSATDLQKYDSLKLAIEISYRTILKALDQKRTLREEYETKYSDFLKQWNFQYHMHSELSNSFRRMTAGGKLGHMIPSVEYGLTYIVNEYAEVLMDTILHREYDLIEGMSKMSL